VHGRRERKRYGVAGYEGHKQGTNLPESNRPVPAQPNGKQTGGTRMAAFAAAYLSEIDRGTESDRFDELVSHHVFRWIARQFNGEVASVRFWKELWRDG